MYFETWGYITEVVASFGRLNFSRLGSKITDSKLETSLISIGRGEGGLGSKLLVSMSPEAFWVHVTRGDGVWATWERDLESWLSLYLEKLVEQVEHGSICENDLDSKRLEVEYKLL